MDSEEKDKTVIVSDISTENLCKCTPECKCSSSLPPVKGEDSPYVILMETNGEEEESWYYFIKYKNNKDALEYLQRQLEQIDFYIIDDLSTFDLDLDNFVSARTAKEMTKVDLNHTSFHRKFDGKLEKIDFGFKRKDSNEKRIFRCFDTLGYGQIEDYIDEEDIDEEDLLSDSEFNSESESDDSDNSSDNSDNERKILSYKEREKERREKRREEPKVTVGPKKMPVNVANLPKFAKHKKRR